MDMEFSLRKRFVLFMFYRTNSFFFSVHIGSFFVLFFHLLARTTRSDRGFGNVDGKWQCIYHNWRKSKALLEILLKGQTTAVIGTDVNSNFTSKGHQSYIFIFRCFNPFTPK